MGNAFVSEIKIHKVRHLHDITIPLSGDYIKHLILTGKNGSGKTSILESLAIYLKHYFSEDIKTPYGTEIAFASCTNVVDAYSNGQYILAYFSDHRSFKVDIPKNIESITLPAVYDISDSPSSQFAKYLVNLKTKQAFAQTQHKLDQANEIQNWFERFTGILQKLYDDPSLQLDFDIDTFQFHILMDGREPFDFNTMSMGYSAVFNIICDLMMRMEAKKNYNMEGLVLIDEVETHLHVDLQKKIMPILTELFPNIQFILTTHSPFVLNSLENAVIYDLEKHLLIENGLANLPYEGIVESYFDVDTMSKTLSDKFNQYKALLQKSSLTAKEHAELAELEMYLDEVPDYLALDFAVEYEQLKLEAGR